MSDSKTADTGQDFDTATGVDTLAVAGSPAQSFAMLDAVLMHALGMGMLNAVTSQQNAAAIRSGTVAMTCSILLSLPVSATANPPKPTPQIAAVLAAAAKAAQAAPADEIGPGTDAGSDDPAATVDPQILDAINQEQLATMSPQVVLTSGAGKAYQMVAQSAAIAIQDATEALRSISTIAAAASGVAMACFLATGEEKYLSGLTAAQDMVKSATEDFTRIGTAAATVLKEFPAG